MSEYDRRGAQPFVPDLLARLSLALRAALTGERDEASLLPLTKEFCREARRSGMPPEAVVVAFRNALGPMPSRGMEGRFHRIREQLITQCIGAYYASSLDAPEVAEPVPGERLYTAGVVDDDPVVARLLQYILGAAFEVRTFDDARDALADFYERRPDLVVFDLHLPDYSGQTLLGVLRSDPRLRAVPAIAVTGDDEPGLEERMRKEGFGAFFRKPLVDAAGILATALRLVEDGRAAGQAAPAAG